MKIEDIDTNLRPALLNGKEVFFRNALEKPFQLSGFAWYADDRTLCRFSQKVMPKLRPEIQNLAYCTTGGMIRFKTDSSEIALRVKYRHVWDLSQMPRSGTHGLDLYLGNGMEKRYSGTLLPAAGAKEVEGLPVSGLPAGINREWTLYLPIYGGVETLEIGTVPGAKLESPCSFSITPPIAYYGSSITHGGCVSRAGTTWVNWTSRLLDAEALNFGFAGQALGDPEIARQIANLSLSAFVYDYDHNAWNPEMLETTHEPFFRIIRERQPELPIVMMSRCDFRGNPEESKKRREIIRKTLEHALAAGDRNVFFLDGETLFEGLSPDDCTVDGCHPNDLGAFRIAEKLSKILENILKK